MSVGGSVDAAAGAQHAAPVDDPYRLQRFVFPQVAGLGTSGMSRTYAVSGLAEARAYLAHPVLGPRLLECTRLVAGLPATSAERVFGGIDAQKLRSSMTLFARAAPEEPVFAEVIARWFDGAADAATTSRL